ncbi:flavodoxin family protein [uncultured Tateyamaria sp.]|uniref:flavodoxin family protein n=1 Tax=uncultured Tateyamaria sp. TaxID=455651 RepID=UPI0026269E68|nr:flavodoxin family protein [uncultured Tateyamaria sp.]
MSKSACIIALPYYSGAGHTAQIATAIAKGADRQGATSHIIDIEQITARDWANLDRADAILFGAPTYMGSVAAAYAAFLEEAGGRWMDQTWADKVAGGFTVATFGSGDKLATLQRLSVFAAQMGMIWVGPNDIGAPVFPAEAGINADGGWLGLMGSSISTPRGAVRPGDLDTGQRFGARVARLCTRMSR